MIWAVLDSCFAITSYHKLGGLKWQKFIFPPLWRPGVQNQGFDRVVGFFWRLRENLFHASLLAPSGCWQSLVLQIFIYLFGSIRSYLQHPGTSLQHVGSFTVVRGPLSNSGTQAPESMDSVVEMHRLSCPTDLVPSWHVGELSFRSGIEPMSPALDGGVLTTGPSGKSLSFSYKDTYHWM